MLICSNCLSIAMMGQESRTKGLEDHRKTLAAAKARALSRVRAGRDAGSASPENVATTALAPSLAQRSTATTEPQADGLDHRTWVCAISASKFPYAIIQ